MSTFATEPEGRAGPAPDPHSCARSRAGGVGDTAGSITDATTQHEIPVQQEEGTHTQPASVAHDLIAKDGDDTCDREEVPHSSTPPPLFRSGPSLSPERRRAVFASASTGGFDFSEEDLAEARSDDNEDEEEEGQNWDWPDDESPEKKQRQRVDRRRVEGSGSESESESSGGEEEESKAESGSGSSGEEQHRRDAVGEVVLIVSSPHRRQQLPRQQQPRSRPQHTRSPSGDSQAAVAGSSSKSNGDRSLSGRRRRRASAKVRVAEAARGEARQRQQQQKQQQQQHRGQNKRAAVVFSGGRSSADGGRQKQQQRGAPNLPDPPQLRHLRAPPRALVVAHRLRHRHEHPQQPSRVVSFDLPRGTLGSLPQQQLDHLGKAAAGDVAPPGFGRHRHGRHPHGLVGAGVLPATTPVQEPTRSARRRCAHLTVDEVDGAHDVELVGSDDEDEDGENGGAAPENGRRRALASASSAPLTRLENVTSLQRALIDPDLLREAAARHHPRQQKRRKVVLRGPAPYHGRIHGLTTTTTTTSGGNIGSGGTGRGVMSTAGTMTNAQRHEEQDGAVGENERRRRSGSVSAKARKFLRRDKSEKKVVVTKTKGIGKKSSGSKSKSSGSSKSKSGSGGKDEASAPQAPASQADTVLLLQQPRLDDAEDRQPRSSSSGKAPSSAAPSLPDYCGADDGHALQASSEPILRMRPQNGPWRDGSGSDVRKSEKDGRKGGSGGSSKRGKRDRDQKKSSASSSAAASASTTTTAVQQLRVEAEAGGERQPSRGRARESPSRAVGRELSPVTATVGGGPGGGGGSGPGGFPEMEAETPVKSNRGCEGRGRDGKGGERMSFAARVRSVSPSPKNIVRSLSRSRSKRDYASAGDENDPDGDENDEDGSSGRRRSFSRGRGSSSSRSLASGDEIDPDLVRPLLVAVTSCRSDAYHHQKAPGATSKLPRKAPSALKLFHELAVGVKDAYEAVGATPTNPEEENGEDGAAADLSEEEREGRRVLWDFMGNLDFLLALVDEVAIDTATRGALKDDSTFKSLRDVIKKCNKVLETMLVRRERKYTLFFRLVQPHEMKEIKKIKTWNAKVEKAVSGVAESSSDQLVSDVSSDADSDVASTASGVSRSSSRGSSMLSRGRSMLPSAGKVRARRATPTPRLRNRHRAQSADSKSSSGTDSAADGFSAVTAPVTSGNLAKLQQSLSDGNSAPVGPMGMNAAPRAQTPLQQQDEGAVPIKPKDELVDVIRGLKAEKENRAKGIITGGLPSDLKPNWVPKADIPAAVPKLPIEYIHRHRLMKQVVNCLLDRGTGPRDTDEETMSDPLITAITSRHSDKAGNGKTTLAVAAIQTVEVRERFCDGIAWIQLGRTPLTEKDIRRLYEELHDQLLMKDGEVEGDDVNDDNSFSTENKCDANSTASTRTSSLESLEKDGDKDNLSANNSLTADQLAKSRRRFQGGELEGMKEDLARILTKRKVLICLDDVWRVEDAKWFIFDPKYGSNDRTDCDDDETHCPFRMLITTRVPSLLSPRIAQEVFVRIFSEHEAVKLLLFSAGRRMYGGKNSPVFQQARVIVKGCGNSPLAVRVAGGMLRSSNRNWTLSSPTWTALLDQCRTSLEEASKIRSFMNSVGRIVDLSFVTVQDLVIRIALRRCFVTFAVAFRDNEWVKVGKGIPKSVVVNLFEVVEAVMGSDIAKISPVSLLDMLETMNLLQKARHGVTSRSALQSKDDDDNTSETDPAVSDDESPKVLAPLSSIETPCYLMHESIKALAEEMASRSSSSFTPPSDEYTSFGSELEREIKSNDGHGTSWSAPLRSAAKYLAQTLTNRTEKQGTEEYQFHRLMVSALIGVSDAHSRIPSVAVALTDNKSSLDMLPGGDRMEAYIAAYLPNHLIRAKMLGSTGEVLADADFIHRRVAALGTVEASRRQVADLIDLRRELAKAASDSSGGGNANVGTKTSQQSSDAPLSPHSPMSSPISKPETPDPTKEEVESPEMAPEYFTENNDIDIGAVQRDASRRLIDEVYRVVDLSSNSSDSLSMAICLSTVGEGLLKSRQPREAMLRLEEAVGIYRGLLGPYHIDVARALNSVAKALVRLGESRVALLKFAEATRIFEACNATRHYDSIANSQSMASLLVDVEDWSKAEAKYDDVISSRRIAYGDNSIPVAKTINDYAVVLAKHGRMDDALRRYEEAKKTYETSLSGENSLSLLAQVDGYDTAKCNFDVTLINLNIASIKSKKGDIPGAIASYEKGVAGLKKYLKEQAQVSTEGGGDSARISSTKRHLVSAMGRIGSLKLKQGNNDGALEAYASLLKAVDNDSPLASRMEKAKAHVKCATIYRQRDTEEDNERAIEHLRQALEMYTDLHGPSHKDTRAIHSSLRQWQSQAQTAKGATI